MRWPFPALHFQFVFAPELFAFGNAAPCFQPRIEFLRQALIELEDIADVETRVTYLAETRCYLAFAYFATRERGLVQVELRRLAAFDPAFAVCGQDAPPGVRALIAELRRNNDL